MPYLIAARVELGSRIVGRIGRARLESSSDGIMVHVVEHGPPVATISGNPRGKAKACTYRLEPRPDTELIGILPGPYADLSMVKDAVERHTRETCAVRSSAPTWASRRPKRVRGIAAEISFDTLVPDQGQSYVEGCYRIARRPWQVFYFTNVWQGRPWEGQPKIDDNCRWLSGITGVQALLGQDATLNKALVKKTLSEVLGVECWSEVLGPDSLELK